MAVGKGFLDQYSVFCVFGSVVGCVVVPLITQSIESVIFSAIVISLTATHLSKRAVSTDTSNKTHGQPHKDPSLKKNKDPSGNKKKSPKKSPAQVEMQVRTSDYRHKKEEKIKRIEEARKLEEQKKQEEKRERKAKKKEERLKQREEEKKVLEEGERRRKLREEKVEKSTSPVSERRKVKNKGTCNANSPQKSAPGSNTRVANSRKSPVVPVVTNSVVTPLDVITAGDAMYHEKPSISPDPSEAKSPSPPPSVWKVPEYVPPQWNPDIHGDLVKGNDDHCRERLNNDVILEQKKRPSTPFNQLRNPVVPSQVKDNNQYMNKDVSKSNVTLKDSDPNLLADVPSKFMEKPDNRTQASGSPYANITGLPSFFKSSAETNGMDLPHQKTYSLFGPEEPNRVLFQPIFQGNLHAPGMDT